MNPNNQRFQQHEIKTFEEACILDPVVYRMESEGFDRTRIIAELARQKQLLVARIVELQSICPKKMKMPDGRVMVWRCPDELIPLSE